MSILVPRYRSRMDRPQLRRPIPKGHRPGRGRKVRDTVANVLEADRKPDGELRQDNTFRYVIATKSETAA